MTETTSTWIITTSITGEPTYTDPAGQFEGTMDDAITAMLDNARDQLDEIDEATDGALASDYARIEQHRDGAARARLIDGLVWESRSGIRFQSLADEGDWWYVNVTRVEV